MTLQKSKSRNLKDEGENKSDANGKSDGENNCYKVMKEAGASSSSSSSVWRHDGSSEHLSDGEDPPKDGETSTKALVIPEKASSFSIHPDRLCSDECAYCFGKFGLFDTPLHIAQIKSVERQNKILENEIYLMRDSCLCDACYRHVDRRSNSSSLHNKSYKRNTTGVLPQNITRQNTCHVLNCGSESAHILRRKWLMKMRKNVAHVIKIDFSNPGLHSIPVCSEHYIAIEHLMVCALCKRRLARNHIHYLGFEFNDLNVLLEKEGIPVKLVDKPVVCKLCRYFSQLLLKPPEETKSTTASFFKQYKKRLLHFHDVEVMDDAEAEEPIAVPTKEKPEQLKRNKRKPKKSLETVTAHNINTEPDHNQNGNQNQNQNEQEEEPRVPCESRESSPNSDTMVDIETLVPKIVFEEKVPKKKTRNNAVDRLGSNPSISVRQLFPGEEDLPLQCNIDFNNAKEKTPEGWEKNSCMIQYDVDTKHLWQELQKPYGNQSSFLRHLILLEKYFRNGDLTLSPHASHHAVNYSVSVQNRLRAYDNIPTNSLPMQPLTMLPFNAIKKSTSGIISSNVNAANIPKNTPIPISQISHLSQISQNLQISQISPTFLAQFRRNISGDRNTSATTSTSGDRNTSATTATSSDRNTSATTATSGDRNTSATTTTYGDRHTNVNVTSGVRHTSGVRPSHEARNSHEVPGLISLNPGKIPQKFKLPIGRTWRPTLIPVNQSKPASPSTEAKRITGVVQVISNGKPYHISLQDYNRMCTMKKNNEMKQKVAEAKLKQREPELSTTSTSSILKPVVPRKQKSPVANSTLLLPKIPKSLTVIPQTVPRKPLQPTSPTLSITTNAKPSTSKS